VYAGDTTQTIDYAGYVLYIGQGGNIVDVIGCFAGLDETMYADCTGTTYSAGWFGQYKHVMSACVEFSLGDDGDITLDSSGDFDVNYLEFFEDEVYMVVPCTIELRAVRYGFPEADDTGGGS
jgi:hypothetical protein